MGMRSRFRLDFRKALKMERHFGMVPLAIFYIISTVFISECSSSADQSGYFLFTPPFGAERSPQEVVANKRSDIGDINEIVPIPRAGIPPESTAESLWVGSHKINWSPLPIFQRFLDHHEQKKQQRQYAQARKYDPEDQEQPQTIKRPKQSKAKFSLLGAGGLFKDSFGHHQHKKHLFHNPHHDFSNKFASGGFFSGLGATFGKNAKPQGIPQNYAQARSSVQPDRDYALPPVSVTQPQSQSTTPIPLSIIHSPSQTFLVSPPETIIELSTPGPSINPIIDRLRKMTEWSNRQTQTSDSDIITKKEGKPNSPLERRLRLKKRIRPPAKAHKHNIEAIILSNDDDDFNDATSTERNAEFKVVKQNNIIVGKSLKLKRKSRGRNVNKEQTKNGGESSEEAVVMTRAIQVPHQDIVALHPTNAAFFNEPLDGQQSTFKSYQLKRKDKKMSVFKNEGAVVSKQAPVSFRFGAEDAKVNPYVK